ncbi:ORF8 [Xestia c-nigrum granulovirus]|uniref:ORF8 n=1 Tax=Xestia c-nigrum granulosis virus TaxID=51677 RepID=Q9PZ33_GVXN|nr:ORF8 [Xestia c-nigrum granulovirus]AAF05122.1 ORF8 [Xestia c-nigrum granulovirus]
MNTITEPNVSLDYEEQKKWTKICELYTYMSRVEDMDDEQLRMVQVLCEGFVGLMNETNKNIVLLNLLDLLQPYVNRSKNYKIEDEY